MENPKKYRKQWLLRAPIGLATVGFGACLVAEAAMKKYDGVPTLEWVIWGTGALVVLNTGLSIFGDAVLWRSRYERAMEKQDKK
ncbi:MAG: hypothetical protein HRU40_11170 [Saprospiraceae bacterium]|nr:hypothetical protein [Saprospiraceae bacterium]